MHGLLYTVEMYYFNVSVVSHVVHVHVSRLKIKSSLNLTTALARKMWQRCYKNTKRDRHMFTQNFEIDREWEKKNKKHIQVKGVVIKERNERRLNIEKTSKYARF